MEDPGTRFETNRIGNSQPKGPFRTKSAAALEIVMLYYWEEEKTNKNKEIRRDTHTSGPQPSGGRVPFVLWKCPVSPADILSKLGRSCRGAMRGARWLRVN